MLAVAVAKKSPYQIPAVPYALPTLLGRLPGYPNSALGASNPINGVDEQVETGLAIPSLSKQLFSIGASECLRENSASGGYLVAQQRLLNFRHPKDDSGISSFVQLHNLFRSWGRVAFAASSSMTAS